MRNIKQIRPQDDKFLRRTSDIDKGAAKLWYVGQIPRPAPAVAIVGSRKPTSYGREVNHQLTTELARAGIIIVSGLAIGHDGLAHRAALEAGGTTVAVIGNGLANPHPHTNISLADQIVRAGGLIISEYPPEQAVFGWQFLARNRLISALADIVVVIEAGEHSGTLNTASHALAQNREVMAVPGNITAPLSRGCNRLIAEGAAPVTCAQDILDHLGLHTEADDNKLRQIHFDSPDAQKIYDLILAGESDGERLAQTSGLGASEFNMALTMLELNGYIQALGGNHWGRR